VKLTLARGQPPFRPPRTALFAAMLLVLLGLALVVLPGVDNGPVACPFRAVTGLPCPTCGLIRAARAIARGDVATAFGINPFDAAFLLTGVPALLAVWVANAACGFVVRFSMSGIERRLAWGLLAVAVAANWIYVITTMA
jgi:hypothetical protein